jgi:predicted GIY-YIG superfamily endonuclease
MKTRNYYKYELKKGNEVLYVGITKDPDRRHNEHRNEKRFGHMLVVGNATTKEGAEKWETQRLKQYAQNHGGNLPRKNKTENGK